MKTLHYSNPQNYRGTFDAIGKAIAGNAVGYAATLLAPIMVMTGGSVAAAKASTNGVFDSEETKGYKQHILREEDADKVTEIIINKDNTIILKSESGDSETVYTSTPLGW